MGSTGNGYIRIYRDIRNHWIWSDAEALRAWIDLIMMVNHQSKKVLYNGRLITVKRGSRITSIRKLASRWGWSRGRTSRFLDMLERDGMIATTRDSKKTLLSIVNYGKFQSAAKESGTLTEPQTEPQTEHKQRMIKNDRKNERKNERKEPAALSSEEEIYGTEDTPWWEVKYGKGPV